MSKIIRVNANRMNNKNAYYIIAVGLTIAILVGCSGNIKKDTAIGLLTTKDALVSTATTVKRLCEQGVLSDDDCAEAKELYGEARKILIEAEGVWSNMIIMDSLRKRAEYETLLAEVAMIAGRIEAKVRGIE